MLDMSSSLLFRLHPPPSHPLFLHLAPSPPRNLPQALHLSGLSACFFIWLVATGGLALADYSSAASHFRFIRPPTPTPSLRGTSFYLFFFILPLSLNQHQCKDITILHHPTTASPPSIRCLPHSISSFFSLHIQIEKS